MEGQFNSGLTQLSLFLSKLFWINNLGRITQR